MKGISLYLLILVNLYLTAQDTGVKNYLEKTMKERHIPGMSVAILSGGEVIFQEFLGLSNVELQTPVTRASIFELASLTKPFTAMGIMQLIANQQLHLEDKINQYIPNAPDFWQDITIYQLLTHSAGFPDQVNLMHGMSPVMDISTEEQLQLIFKEKLLFPPGTKSLYSDPGYFLLGLIIEKVSGLKYAEFLQKNIFDVLKMEHTSVQNKWAILKNRVAAYRFIEGELQNARRDYLHELPAHFGLLSTIDDLIKWSRTLRTNQLITADWKKKIFTAGKLKNAEKTTVWGQDYGLGWMLGTLEGQAYAEHGGFSGTHLLHFLEKDLTIIVLTNLDLRSRSNPRSIAHHIAGLVDHSLRKPDPKYFNQIPPDSFPKVFAPNIISLPDRWEGNASFSADGKELYFNVFKDSTKSIFKSRFINGKWETPSPFEAIGKENNWEPFINLNGKEFYFISSRPPGTPEWNGRIWKSKRLPNNDWAAPEMVDLGWETQNGYWFPNTSLKNKLFFGGNFPEVGNQGKGDLYYWNATTEKTYNLEKLNTAFEEWDPFIAPDESFILWASDKDGGYGGTDLYVSFWSIETGDWEMPINLGDKINTEAYEVAPRISPDGKYLFFDRPMKGTQDIYWVSMDVIYALKPNQSHFQAIQQTINDYFYGYINRDAHRLNRAFDTTNGTMKLPYTTEDGKMGFKNGYFKEIIPRWVNKESIAEAIKKDCFLEILDIDIVEGKMATAQLKMKIGKQTYLDVLSLQKIDQIWKITNKMYIEL